ncbi:NAD(P)/FAD-dependent oxidoreductase [Paenibacillus sp. LHD-117]|uniref:NAD(P)/FAD-dependent oxidoreductase n=1 Tax=Paenibacillus sp. LHD-117 TaxID=3071412 RepID=UPI0027DF947F|nr:NAD(P)/FAD-dependent oxidoreductase [Paenibacillus sp. LHD-117]MDQ6418781.1 NAD(P)/FAD-dependent oxidoreductase [Paenibacillus sp. LHD-117]
MEVECAIIGGGPAGLNAALVLGRARRSVLLFDDHTPRNAVTRHTHGFMTRDGARPEELRELARQDIARYPSVYPVDRRVEAVAPAEGGGFLLRDRAGSAYYARKLLLATGLKETLPNIPEVEVYYGKSLFNCPYCDGWELRDQPLVVIAEGANAFSLTRLAYQWSRDLLVCTNGSTRSLSGAELRTLWNKGVAVTQHRIEALAGENGQLRAVRFENGAESSRVGGFVSPYWRQASPFGEQLGCAMNHQGGIQTDGLGRTSVHGVYAAGDSSIIAPAQTAIAAGEGSRAAIGMNSDLIREDFA